MKSFAGHLIQFGSVLGQRHELCDVFPAIYPNGKSSSGSSEILQTGSRV